MVSTAARRRRRCCLRNLAASSAILVSSIALAKPPTDSVGTPTKQLMAAKFDWSDDGSRRTRETQVAATNEAIAAARLVPLPPPDRNSQPGARI